MIQVLKILGNEVTPVTIDIHLYEAIKRYA